MTILAAQRIFYVYVRFRPNGVPCYVGKGTGSRALTSAKRYWHNQELVKIATTSEYELPCIIIRDNLTEAEAFDIEKALIKAIGCKWAGPLVNKRGGGAGVSGHKRPDLAMRNKSILHINAVRAARIGRHLSESQKDVLRKTNLGKKHSAESRAKMSLIRTGKIMSEETRQKLSRSRHGENNPFFGKKHSEETLLRMSAAHRASRYSQNYIQSGSLHPVESAG